MSEVADCVTLGDHFAHLLYHGSCGCGRGADMKLAAEKKSYAPDPKPAKKPKKKGK